MKCRFSNTEIDDLDLNLLFLVFLLRSGRRRVRSVSLAFFDQITVEKLSHITHFLSQGFFPSHQSYRSEYEFPLNRPQEMIGRRSVAIPRFCQNIFFENISNSSDQPHGHVPSGIDQHIDPKDRWKDISVSGFVITAPRLSQYQ